MYFIFGMRLSKDALRMLAAAVLGEELKGYTLKKNVDVPSLVLGGAVDIIATSQDQHTVFKRVYVFCEAVDRLVPAEVETHQVIKDELKKHVEFGPKDEYWVIAAGTIDESCEPKGIVLKDWRWLSSKLKEHMPRSRKVREVVHTLEAAGILKSLE